jgi:hypothetical protein
MLDAVPVGRRVGATPVGWDPQGDRAKARCGGMLGVMTRDDRPTDPPVSDVLGDEDPDRAAILARRRRFVAVALSGLAVGAGCPQPCLSVAPPPESDRPPAPPPDDGIKPEVPPSEPQPEPTPCLKVLPPKEPEPTPCLKVAPPKEPEGKPKPCLRVARPTPEDD